MDTFAYVSKSEYEEIVRYLTSACKCIIVNEGLEKNFIGFECSAPGTRIACWPRWSESSKRPTYTFRIELGGFNAAYKYLFGPCEYKESEWILPDRPVRRFHALYYVVCHELAHAVRDRYLVEHQMRKEWDQEFEPEFMHGSPWQEVFVDLLCKYEFLIP